MPKSPRQAVILNSRLPLPQYSPDEAEKCKQRLWHRICGVWDEIEHDARIAFDFLDISEELNTFVIESEICDVEGMLRLLGAIQIRLEDCRLSILQVRACMSACLEQLRLAADYDVEHPF